MSAGKVIEGQRQSDEVLITARAPSSMARTSWDSYLPYQLELLPLCAPTSWDSYLSYRLELLPLWLLLAGIPTSHTG
ncbi:hypothetical protein J6590_098998 [Homalodisca vitripennis]|nr:hypothetical protein J6590_098998 [Homalodisca vitripennis]